MISNVEYKNRAAKDVVWTAMGIIATNLFSLVVRLILASLMLPDEFGIIGIAAVFTGLVQTINELGMSAALIQKSESEMTDDHYSSAYWMNQLFSIFLFLLMVIVVSPLAASFYDIPELKMVIIVLSIPIIIKPLVFIHNIKLTKKFKFKNIAITQIVGSVFGGGLSITLAYLGFGIWSLVLLGLFQVVISIPLYWFFERWKPSIAFSFSAIKSIFSFSLFVFLKSLLTYFSGNIDYLIIGRLMNDYYVGVYTLAFTLTDIFRRNIMSILNRVLFPYYSKVKNDKTLVKKMYLKVVKYNTAVIFPIMVGMMLVSKQFILTFYGGDWSFAITPINILVGSVILHVIVGSYSTVLVSIGKPNLDFYIFFSLTLFVTVPALFILINLYGIIGAALAILISKFINMIIAIYFLHKYIGLRLIDNIQTILPNLLSVSIMFIGVFLIQKMFNVESNLLGLFIQVITGVVLYLIPTIFVYKNELIDIKNNIKKYMNLKFKQ